MKYVSLAFCCRRCEAVEYEQFIRLHYTCKRGQDGILFYISFERAKSTNYDDVIATIPSLLQAELQGVKVSQKMEKGRVGVVFSCHKIKR